MDEPAPALPIALPHDFDQQNPGAGGGLHGEAGYPVSDGAQVHFVNQGEIKQTRDVNKS